MMLVYICDYVHVYEQAVVVGPYMYAMHIYMYMYMYTW